MNRPSRPLSDRMKAEMAGKDYSVQARKTARPQKNNGQPEFDFDTLPPMPTLESTQRKLDQKKKTSPQSSRTGNSVKVSISDSSKKKTAAKPVAQKTTPRANPRQAPARKSAADPSSKKTAASSSTRSRQLDDVVNTVRTKSRTTSSKAASARRTAEHVQKKQEPEKLFRLLVAAIVMVCVAGAAFFIVPYVLERSSSFNLTPVLPGGRPGGEGNGAHGQSSLVPVEIGSGWGASAISKALADAGIIRDASSFLSYVQAQGALANLRSGVHYLQPDMEHADVLAALMNVQGDEIQVTVFAGYTLADIDALLVSRGVSSQGDFQAATHALAETEGLGFAEGWFMAGEYVVPVSHAAQALASSMYYATLHALRPVLGTISAQDFTLEEVVIIASMITGETKNSGEMPVISGIIRNRLQQQIPLGIDATTRYETGNWTRPIDPSVFEQRTPYNTRRVAGLPPTGICAPSAEALLAAAQPQKTPWFYYLHDSQGNIHYAVDYEGHKQNITHFLGK